MLAERGTDFKTLHSSVFFRPQQRRPLMCRPVIPSDIDGLELLQQFRIFFGVVLAFFFCVSVFL